MFWLRHKKIDLSITHSYLSANLGQILKVIMVMVHWDDGGYIGIFIILICVLLKYNKMFVIFFKINVQLNSE